MKKIISVFAAIAIMLAALCTAVFAADPAVRYGDVNGDGKINARDVTAIMRYIVDKNTPIDVQAADVMKNSGGDPFINARDVIALMKYLVGFDIILGKDVPTAIPSASDFSDEKLEARLNPIVRLKSATLYKNGTVTEFAPDDPKIIRLINFISYPDADMLISEFLYIGFWDDEYIAKKRTESFRMEIEVENDNEYGNHMYYSFQSEQFETLVIFGNEVLEYSSEVDNSSWLRDHDGCTRCAESYWPYSEFGYFNILEWCGF